jgi:hypothetical protein
VLADLTRLAKPLDGLLPLPATPPLTGIYPIADAVLASGDLDLPGMRRVLDA